MASAESSAGGASDENKSPIASLPQIYASFAAASYHLVLGMSLAYSAILLPQLQDEQNNANGTNTTYIKIDKQIASWIASVLTFATFPSAVIAAVLVDGVGRLNLNRIAVIPTVIGWIMIALGKDATWLIVGRILLGIPQPWATCSGATYIAEISSPALRGSLTSLNSFCISFGILIGYILGAFMHWRIVAWMCVIASVLPIVLLLCVPESYSYLLMKGRDQQALKSLQWFNKFQSPEFTEKQFNATRDRILAIKQARQQLQGSKFKRVMTKFTSPACIKPLLIVCGAFFFQNFTGIFITLFYAVNFIQDIGTDINPYMGSIYVGTARALVSVANVWLLKRFKRRHLLLTSTFGMTVSMVISGYFTNWIQQGASNIQWVPITAIISYITFSMVGLLPLCFIYAAEMFPINIRGVIQSITLFVSYIFMFAALKLYYNMLDAFGGIVGIQYYFAVMSFAAFIYTLILVPESHKKTLDEIEEYFMHNTIYLSLNCKKKTEVERT